MTVRSSIFKSNRSQAVRLPKDIAFADSVKQVAVWRHGNQRILAPADAVWDTFFDSPGVDLGEREQPPVQERAPL